jgi:membrane-associated PAP2 superfamily phosphatase
MLQVWRACTASLPLGVKRLTSPWQVPSVPVAQVVVSLAVAASVVVPLPALAQVAGPYRLLQVWPTRAAGLDVAV